jgi:protoporphyrinogen oxidase
MTRREAIVSLAGAATAGACRKRRRAAPPPGEIVGVSDAFGHRLQRGFRPQPPADAWHEVDVVIVGGGVAGLSAGYRLVKAGFERFVQHELERDPGGTSRSGGNEISAYPWAAHYLPVPHRHNRPLLRLLREMGVVTGQDADGRPVAAEEHLCWDPQERIFYKGSWYEGLYLRAGASSEDLRQLEAFSREIDRWVAWRDGRGRRAFTLPMALGSDDSEARALDRLSMAEYLDRLDLRSPRLRWLVEYSCRDDYGTLLADTSAWAGLFYFTSRVERPGEEAAPFLTWPEGNGRIVAYLHATIAPRVRLGVAATEIVPKKSQGNVGVDVLAFDRSSGLPVGFRARRVVFAAPQYLARYLIRPYRDDPPSHIDAFDYGPWLVANLTLDDRPRGRGFPLAWDNVLYESQALGYVVATHQSGRDRGPTVATFYHAFCDSDARASRTRLLEGDRETWADFILSDLERAHPEIRALTTRLDVVRWGHAMIRPRRGFMWSNARLAAARPFRGVHFAHSDLSGMALFEEAYHHGLRAAEEVLDALARPPSERWA